MQILNSQSVRPKTVQFCYCACEKLLVKIIDSLIVQTSSDSVTFRSRGKPIAAQFCQSNHLVGDLEVRGIAKIYEEQPNQDKRKSYWIFTLKTLAPRGMNLDDWTLLKLCTECWSPCTIFYSCKQFPSRTFSTKRQVVCQFLYIRSRLYVHVLVLLYLPEEGPLGLKHCIVWWNLCNQRLSTILTNSF